MIINFYKHTWAKLLIIINLTMTVVHHVLNHISWWRRWRDNPERRLTIIQQDSLSPLTVLTLLLFNHNSVTDQRVLMLPLWIIDSNISAISSHALTPFPTRKEELFLLFSTKMVSKQMLIKIMLMISWSVTELWLNNNRVSTVSGDSESCCIIVNLLSGLPPSTSSISVVQDMMNNWSSSNL